ncbi:hypothetical protein MPER_12717 [Moniliophthora perniciosa FA553]|nr:hypothetical protein MPER_12717 [Moniliophthora perniciosa FA553]
MPKLPPNLNPDSGDDDPYSEDDDVIWHGLSKRTNSAFTSRRTNSAGAFNTGPYNPHNYVYTASSGDTSNDIDDNHAKPPDYVPNNISCPFTSQRQGESLRRKTGLYARNQEKGEPERQRQSWMSRPAKKWEKEARQDRLCRVDALALQAICWPATQFTMTMFDVSTRPVTAWAIAGTSTCMSRRKPSVVNLPEATKKDFDGERGPKWRGGRWGGRRWDWNEVVWKFVYYATNYTISK